MNRSILFLLLLFITSCENDLDERKYRIINEADFKEIAITSQKHFFEEIINPSSIGLVGNNLIISEAWRVPEENPRIHLINSKNWIYDKAKGKHGQGPLELIDAGLFFEGNDPNTF